MTDTELHKELQRYHERKKLGGIINLGTSLRKDSFGMVNNKSRQVVMKLNSDIDKPILIHGINFVPKELAKISGEIASAILRDFGQYFTVIAATMMLDTKTGEVGFFELDYNDEKDTYRPKRKGSVLVRFDQAKLKLMSDYDRMRVREAKEIEVKAQEVKRIAEINAKAIELAKAEGSN